MDFERLEEFTVIARQKSIKKAGEILSVSPAALRARLEAFEASLGTALFLRQKDGLILTESGSRLYSNALSIVSRYHALKSELTFTDREKYHTLRIAVAGTQLPFYLEPFLGQLCKKYPDIHLDILDDRSFSIEEGLLNDHIDL